MFYWGFWEVFNLMGKFNGVCENCGKDGLHTKTRNNMFEKLFSKLTSSFDHVVFSFFDTIKANSPFNKGKFKASSSVSGVK